MQDWQVIVNFMIDIINKLPTGREQVRIGMVTFADTAKSDAFLSGTTDRETLINALRNARQAKYVLIRIDSQSNLIMGGHAHGKVTETTQTVLPGVPAGTWGF